MMSPTSLRRLEEAARDVDAARARFFDAIRAAHESGHTYTVIGQTLGITRQAAQQLGRKAEKQAEPSAGHAE